MGALEQIAKTVLYEGYVLWPYRRSAVKNQQRWTFGGIYPRAYADVSGGADRSVVRTECLIEATANARVTVSVRFLHVVARQVMRCDATGDVAVNELTVAGTRYLSWDEATERTFDASVSLDAEDVCVTEPICVDSGSLREALLDGTEEVGAVVRSWDALQGTIEVTVRRGADRVRRVSVVVTNEDTWNGSGREQAVRHTFNSAHVVLRAVEGAFVSQFDPPADLAIESAANRNEGVYPVLVGEDGARDTMLASAMILYDYPRIAPESPGDLFDGGEIDQLLILNILTLTEDEQREMSDSDPRAREILERCKALTSEELMRLHGAVRSLQPLSVGAGVAT